MTNEQILKYFKSQVSELRDDLIPNLKNDILLNSLYQKFSEFDFIQYQSAVEIEIKQNVEEWWINPEKGIIPEEKLYAILFEYSTAQWGEIEALSFGINKWENRKSFDDDYDMGYLYDFATEFYAAPGFNLDYFTCLEILDNDSNLEDKYKDCKYFDLKGFDDLIELIRFTGMIKIHEVFLKLDKEKVFEKINTLENFIFIIGEHDDITFPIFAK